MSSTELASQCPRVISWVLSASLHPPGNSTRASGHLSCKASVVWCYQHASPLVRPAREDAPNAEAQQDIQDIRAAQVRPCQFISSAARVQHAGCCAGCAMCQWATKVSRGLLPSCVALQLNHPSSLSCSKAPCAAPTKTPASIREEAGAVSWTLLDHMAFAETVKLCRKAM